MSLTYEPSSEPLHIPGKKPRKWLGFRVLGEWFTAGARDTPEKLSLGRPLGGGEGSRGGGAPLGLNGALLPRLSALA